MMFLGTLFAGPLAFIAKPLGKLALIVGLTLVLLLGGKIWFVVHDSGIRRIDRAAEALAVAVEQVKNIQVTQTALEADAAADRTDDAKLKEHLNALPSPSTADLDDAAVRDALRMLQRSRAGGNHSP